MGRTFISLQRAADLNSVDYGTVRNRVRSGDLAAFKLPGRRGHYVDKTEAREVLTRRARYGSFGPDAVVHDLSSVVADFAVDE